MSPEIKIIGCGVSGLTTGILLLENAHKVEIITEKLPAQTTSAIAAAIWFPYAVHPKEKVNHWSKISYQKFRALSENPNTGISMINLTTIIKEEDDAWWTAAFPPKEIRKATKDELPADFELGYFVKAPLIETPIYLNYLLNRFKELGGKISIRTINNFEAISTKKNVVINCTGLASKELVGDQLLYPIQGQIAKVVLKKNINCIIAEFTFDEAGTEVAYIIPRNDCVVLGGTAVKNSMSTIPNEKVTKGIIKRCKILDPDLMVQKIKHVEVGLRPGRTEIRLERIGNIIHNYGHGGAGFTVSWGCAEAVKRLLS